MFGKKFEDYARFDRWFVIAVIVVFVVRLGLSLAGAPNAQTKWVSLNGVLLIGLIYTAIAVHTTGFGSYRHLFALLLFPISVAHTLIALAIVLGIVTGNDNIFTAPEYFGGSDGKNWMHVFAHFIAAPILSAIAWIPATFILFVTRRVRPRPNLIAT